MTLKAGETRFRGTVPEDLSLPADKLDDVIDEYFRHVGKDILETVLGGEENSDVFAWTIIRVLENFVRDRVIGPLSLPAFFLPADRTGVMRAHGAMVRNLIGNAPRSDCVKPHAHPCSRAFWRTFSSRLSRSTAFGPSEAIPCETSERRLKEPSLAVRCP